MHSLIKSQIIIISTLYWFVCSVPLQAQFQLTFHGTDSDLQELKKYGFSENYADSLQMLDQLERLLREVQLSGRLQAEFKTVWNGQTNLQAMVLLGPSYKWVNLRPGNVDPQLLREVGYKEKFYRNKPFHFREAARLLHRIVKRSGESGYPFASVRLDSVVMKGSQVAASLNYAAGPHITFDSLGVQGNLAIRKEFLQSYLGMQPGDPFSESRVAEAVTKLNRLPYAVLSEAPGLSFQNNQATTYLTLQRRPANQIDGIIGFLPNAKNNGQLLLTGQFNLLLYNMFGGGRKLQLQWESFKPQSQLLNVSFFQPLLWRSPINTSLGFRLLKEDSTFLNTQFELEFSYLFHAYGTLQAFTHVKSTRLSATASLERATELGDLSDFDITEYGLGYQWSKLDNILNPSRGTAWSIELGAGTKKLKRNSSLNDSLYAEVDLESAQAIWEAQLHQYWKVGRYWVIAAKLEAGGVYNKRLFFNDLFRLGGLKSIRGFSENSFFAAEYIYSTVEPRFFFDTDSYLFVFYDQGWRLTYELENESFSDTPSGLGAGISLTTRAGNFNFAWAVGKSKTQVLGVAQSKIHFGYITKF